MNKRYEYGGLIYCEDDLSLEIDNYGGDLYSLYLDLRKDREVDEITYYYVTDCYGDSSYYEDYEDLIESEFSDLEVDENE